MSKFVNEIIEDIKKNPATFVDYKGYGVKKGDLIISGYGNSKALSIINVWICDKTIPTTFMDKWRLESTIKWWYKNINLNHLIAPNRILPL